MTRIVSTALAALCLLSAAGAASAQDHRVAYGDLDMASPADASRFDRRVSRAARSACDGGAPLATAVCVTRFKAEVMERLPAAFREDYARARSGRIET